ncbi:MAG: UvrD-helicase domain-containing protein [Dehalococcoidia bacterium]|nr:UvrD-helicase domain-containing protein [Dehalococcoidia bacterium]
MSTDILEGLNPPQREAVETTDGPLLILAGPGSGKTRVIAHRIAYLVAHRRVSPYRIMAVTFTNKAAREMKERVFGLIGEQMQAIALGTFHAICARILRVDGERTGVGRGFAIYDEADQIAVMRRALAELQLDQKRYHPKALLAIISKAKSELATPETYAQSVSSYFEEVVARAYERYQSLLTENNALDFDDLLLKAVLLFREHADVLEKYQERYRYLLIDEFQDTNVAQYALARQLAARHGNICVVGDPDQSIYSWRSADLRNILNFERDFPNARVVYLEQNYRSTQTILDSAHSIISRNEQRKEKSLWTDRGPGKPVMAYEAYDEEEEAEFVAAQVQSLVSGGEHRWGDIAVMYRTNAQSRPLEEAFVRENIRYRLIGGTRFYERREVKDIMAYLRLIHNPFDSVSLARVINVPARGIGQRTMEELGRWANELQVPMYAALQLVAEQERAEATGEGAETPRHPFAARVVRNLLPFLDLVNELIAEAPDLTLSELLTRLIERIEYRQFLLGEFEDGEERWDNVQELRNVAAEYDGLAPEQALISFLEDVALMTDTDEYDEKVDAVTLITLHAAKGLEFPVVFIVGMEEGMLPHIRSYDDPAQMEEERRLCYVGVTRAKERLYLVRAFRRHHMGMGTHNPPSRFLKDIPPELLVAAETSTRYGEPVTRRRAGAAGRQAWSFPSDVSRDTPAEPAFVAGDRVRHARFGEGIVVSCEIDGMDQKVTVAFKGEAGIKKLLLSYAPLERVPQ